MESLSVAAPPQLQIPAPRPPSLCSASPSCSFIPLAFVVSHVSFIENQSQLLSPTELALKTVVDLAILVLQLLFSRPSFDILPFIKSTQR